MTDLRGATLARANLQLANFRDAQMQDANFHASKASAIGMPVARGLRSAMS